MNVLQSTLSLTPAYPLENLAPQKDILLLDIETTGFSANHASIYLIGCIYYACSSASWKLCQWFCESPEEEASLLASFFSFLAPFTTLIHYNGDAFDLPFIRSRSQFHKLACPLSGLTSIDLYQKIRPWKAALSLRSLKQASLEPLLGISRIAPYTGRQLIAVYQDYLSSQKTSLLHLLIQHNQEDLQGLFGILPLLAYADLPAASFSLVREQICNTENRLTLELLCQSPCAVSAPFQIEYPLAAIRGQKPGFSSDDIAINPFASIQGQDTQITCRLPMYQGELKYFYPDYKNYYYLPCEDMAIHKSVGSYVAKEARKKATPQTCYSKKTGLFFPQPTTLLQPAFQIEYQRRPIYAEYQEGFFSNSKTLSTFLRAFFPLCP